jgi:hypothetical protein
MSNEIRVVDQRRMDLSKVSVGQIFTGTIYEVREDAEVRAYANISGILNLFKIVLVDEYTTPSSSRPLSVLVPLNMKAGPTYIVNGKEKFICIDYREVNGMNIILE